jgi:tRNA threonylcarbamoyl adenosine modification protein YeaZ
MLILAIDTALDACAAAVLDTSAGGVIASESQAMKRGHAEALMPLIARVMKASGVAFAALDRIAATTGPGSFTGLRVGLSAARGIALAAGKPVVGVTTLTAFAAPIVSENAEPHPVLAAIDARHDHVYFQVIGGDGSSLIKPKVAPIAEALDAARLVRHIWSAMRRRFWPTAGRPMQRRPSRSISRPRPISPGWRGWVPPSARKLAGTALLSARARRQAAEGFAVRRSTAAGIAMTWLSEWWRGGTAVIEPANQRDAARLAQLHGASFHRGWGEGEFEVMLTERNTLVHRLRQGARSSALRCRAWRPTRRSYCRSPSMRPTWPRPVAHLLLTHLGHLAGRGVRKVFLEVEENNQPARRLYEWAGFEVVGRRERYYQQPGGEQLNALLMRRDLS